MRRAGKYPLHLNEQVTSYQVCIGSNIGEKEYKSRKRRVINLASGVLRRTSSEEKGPAKYLRNKVRDKGRPIEEDVTQIRVLKGQRRRCVLIVFFILKYNEGINFQ